MMQSTIPLDREDHALLNKGVKKPGAGIIVFIIVLIGIGYSGYRFMDSLIPPEFCIVFALMVPGWYLLQKHSAKALTSSGKKTVYSGVLGKKVEKVVEVPAVGDDFPGENRYYYFHLDEKQFEVPAEFFQDFREGDTVMIHATIPGNIVFRVTPG